VQFRGAIPGGHTGKSILFSLVMPAFSSDASGVKAPFRLADFKAFRNDGLGTPAQVTVNNFSFGQAVPIDDAVSEQLFLDDTKKDDVPPEIFSPSISRDDRVFNGKWFITFASQDKQSGIDHYEIQEARSGKIDAGKWERAESPYLLEDQKLHSFIFIIAMDRQGNERVIKIFPRNPMPWFKQPSKLIFTSLGLLGLLALGYLIARRRRNNDSLKI